MEPFSFGDSDMTFLTDIEYVRKFRPEYSDEQCIKAYKLYSDNRGYGYNHTTALKIANLI